MYNDELQFERDFIRSLQENGWTDGILKNPTEKDLINNWARILFENNRQQDRLSDYPMTDTEMQQVIDQINKLKYPVKLNSFINGRTISIISSIVFIFNLFLLSSIFIPSFYFIFPCLLNS